MSTFNGIIFTTSKCPYVLNCHSEKHQARALQSENSVGTVDLVT